MGTCCTRAISIYLCLGSMATSALMASAVYATETPDPFELSPEELFNAAVTVTSVSKTEETLMDAPAAIYVLAGDDIRRSGATSLPEALRLVPGVQVARFGTAAWVVTVRGFASDLANKLLVLVDGREVYNHLYSGVYWDVQDTLLEDIDRVEVIRGPGATLWGSNAVNGVINIITKKASDTQGVLTTGLIGNQEAISGARYGGMTEDAISYRVYGKYSDRDRQKAFSGNALNDDMASSRGGFRADWGSGRDDFTLQGDLYQYQIGNVRNIPILTAPYASLIEEEGFASGGNLLTRWARDGEDGSRFEMQGYVDYTHRDANLLVETNTAYDIDAQYAFVQMGRHKLLAGGKLRYTVNNLTGSSQVRLTKEQRDDLLMSGFLQDKITLMPDRWFLTLGSKFEHNELSGYEIQPSARVQFLPDNERALWASVARAVRTPSRIERDANIDIGVAPPSVDVPVPVLVPLLPNPDFNAEEVIAYEVGYRHQWSEDVVLDITAFFNDYASLATSTIGTVSIINNGVDPVHAIFPVSITNSTKGTVSGVETAIDWQASDVLSFAASWSVLNIELEGPPPNIAIDAEVAENRSPHHQLSFRSQWDVTDSIEFDAIIGHTDQLSGVRVPDYWRLDLRLGWKVVDGLMFDLVGQNLIDDQHAEFATANSGPTVEIPRSIYGRFTWQF